MPGPSAEGPGGAWGGGVGGNPLWVYFHIGYRILDIGFVNIMSPIRSPSPLPSPSPSPSASPSQSPSPSPGSGILGVDLEVVLLLYIYKNKVNASSTTQLNPTQDI